MGTQPTTVSYDPSGPMLERAGPGETLAYGCDKAGRLTGITRNGSSQAAFSYGSEQRHDETGLINLRARYYDPAIGRFLSRDSLPGVMSVPQSWNRYSYTENDPINHLDPFGHKKIKWPNGQDPDDDSHARKKAKACKYPGQYTGSCKGGPPNAAYAADGEAQHEAKKSGQAAAAGNLAAAAHLQAAAHFSSIAGTAAAQTATLQAYASLVAATNSIQAAHRVDNIQANAVAAQSGGWAAYAAGLFSIAFPGEADGVDLNRPGRCLVRRPDRRVRGRTPRTGHFLGRSDPTGAPPTSWMLSWRLRSLRGWSHDETNTVPARAT